MIHNDDIVYNTVYSNPPQLKASQLIKNNMTQRKIKLLSLKYCCQSENTHDYSLEIL